LKHVRPGNSVTTGTSDGTVVAIGDLESEQNRRFVDLAEELGAYLNRDLLPFLWLSEVFNIIIICNLRNDV
jgi:hypothetical protein